MARLATCGVRGQHAVLLLEADLVDALEQVLDVVIRVHAVDHRSHI